jgi:simple sugar transport system substrate-binding protein/basic membrane protein A
MTAARIVGRRALWLIVMALLATGVAACGQGSEDGATEPAQATATATADAAATEAPAEDIKLAVVLPGKIDDGSWNTDGLKGLEAAGEALGAETAYVENVGPSNQEQALRNFASQGMTVVFAHGGQYESAVETVAPQFPDTQFVTISGAGKGTGPNINVYGVDFAQPYYVQGFIAAKITKSKRLGVVTALQGLENVNQLVSGWRAGAKAADPSVKTTVVYLKNNEDPAEAKAAAQAMISDGVDVLMVGALNAAQQGVIQAAKEGKAWLGTQYANFTKEAPDQVMTTQLYTWGSMYTMAAEKHESGELTGISEQFGLADDPAAPGTTFQYDDKNQFNPKIPAAVLEEAQKVIDDLKAGSIEIEVSKEAAAPGTR